MFSVCLYQTTDMSHVQCMPLSDDWHESCSVYASIRRLLQTQCVCVQSKWRQYTMHLHISWRQFQFLIRWLQSQNDVIITQCSYVNNLSGFIRRHSSDDVITQRTLIWWRHHPMHTSDDVITQCTHLMTSSPNAHLSDDVTLSQFFCWSSSSSSSADRLRKAAESL